MMPFRQSHNTPSHISLQLNSLEKYIGQGLAVHMLEAGREEREIAIQNNKYHDGVPAITVIVDGG